MRSYSPTIVALSMRRDVAEQRVGAAIAADRHDAQIVERRQTRLRHLDLHLERDARRGSAQ